MTQGRSHPRTLGWIGTSALAMGGSNQSLFLIGALVVGQGTAAVPLLAVGLLLSWAAAPGWTELVLMWPDRVGGISACCAEAFRPYGPVLANLAGVCYWWGWVPTCGLTAILSATALHEWYLPGVPVTVIACVIVVAFTAINLRGIRAVTRLAIPLACCSAVLALLAGIVPVLSGSVDWHRAASFTLHSPFHGLFGAFTAGMAGLYLIGFAAPAFEAAACHVGETRDPGRNVPRAMLVSAGIATLYFVVLPTVWLGTIGRPGLSGDLAHTLGPTFAPLLGSGAKSAAIGFMVFNMFHGTLQPLAGASRTLSQLSEDGLLPRMLARRNRHDTPWVATALTAGMSIAFLIAGDPTWLIAAANLTYLIGIGLPSVAVALLRRHAPDARRLYRAPRGMVALGVAAAATWGLTTIFGFEQYGLPTVLAGIAFAYVGSGLYAWRAWRDRVAVGIARVRVSLHFKLTGAMLAVMLLDAGGYLLAVENTPRTNPALVTALSDIFVAVALLTIGVGLILPGSIVASSREVADAALRLSRRTLGDLTRAMEALDAGELDAAQARADVTPVRVRSRDELGLVAESFNVMQAEVAQIATALDGAREGVRAAGNRLERNLAQQAAVARLGQRALEASDVDDLLADAARAIRSVMQVDCAAIVVFDGGGDDGRRLRVRAVDGITVRASGVPYADAVLRALDARAPIATGAGAVGAVGAAGALISPLAPVLPSSPHDGLLVAIRGGNSGDGALVVDSIGPRTFAADEVDFLHAIGNLLSEAIQRNSSVDEIRWQALHDPLTGLPNRTLFVDHLTVAIAQARRTDSTVAVLFLDLDNFKLINDGIGHGAGDQVLQRIAGRLEHTLRPGDTVARFGGDEFVMICGGLRSPREAEPIAARIAAVLDAPVQIGDVEHHIGASIGIVAATGNADHNVEGLLRDADAAMYQAKERGRHRFEVFDAEMRDRSARRLGIANDLNGAVDRGEIGIVYQPIVEVASGAVLGFEALARWTHPVRGPVSPAEFIPIAEDGSAIMEIGAHVIRQACADAAAWVPAGGEIAPWVSINLSLRQVRHGRLAEFVAGVLADTGMHPARLHVEITESVLMRETETSMRCLDELKAIGVTLALDDFGTGYSSLAYVKRFPIDIIKIDRSFITELDRDDRDAKIVEAVIYMARGLRLEVVAEGVETAAQATALADLDCRLAQGWLYSKAVDAAGVATLVGEMLGPAVLR